MANPIPGRSLRHEIGYAPLRHGTGQDLAIHAGLAHPARQESRHLGAEMENQNSHGPRGRWPEAHRSARPAQANTGWTRIIFKPCSLDADPTVSAKSEPQALVT